MGKLGKSHTSFLFFLFFSITITSGEPNILCSTKSWNCTTAPFQDKQLFYQLGEPRSASTYQFNALCATVIILYGHENVSCKYLSYNEKKKYNVIKSHTWGDIHRIKPLSDGKSENFILFLSTRSGAVPTTPNYEGDLHFIQYFKDFLFIGDSILQYYRDLFDLKEKEFEILHEYMHYWEIMRKCCAKTQSSASFVSELKGEKAKKTPFLYNDCKFYDLDAIGSMMKNTTFCQITKDNTLCPGPNRCRRSVHFLQEQGQKELGFKKMREEREEKERRERQEKEREENKEGEEGVFK